MHVTQKQTTSAWWHVFNRLFIWWNKMKMVLVSTRNIISFIDYDLYVWFGLLVFKIDLRIIQWCLGLEAVKFSVSKEITRFYQCQMFRNFTRKISQNLKLVIINAMKKWTYDWPQTVLRLIIFYKSACGHYIYRDLHKHTLLF